MRKYLYLFVSLLACPMLHAAEQLKFTTILSAPVGSFPVVETLTCSYPNIKGTASGPLDFSNQVVVNFGPTGKEGTINLEGGPLQIDTLLLEDNTVFNSGSTVWMVDDTGSVELYPNANLQVARAFITTLQIPTNLPDGSPLPSNTGLTVEETLELKWQNLRVGTLGIPRLNTSHLFTEGTWGNFTIKADTTGSSASGAGFNDLPKSTKESSYVTPPGAKFLVQQH